MTDSNAVQGALNAALEVSMDAIVMMDQRGIILLFNSAATRMFGYEKDEAIGQPMADLLMQEDFARAHDGYVATHLRTGRRRMLGGRRQEVATHRDGRAFPVELTAARLDHDGEAIFVAFIRDLTSAKRMKEAERRAQKMEVVARMTAGVAHDFNNLLTPILGAIDSVESSDPEIIETLEVVHECASRGADLVARLMAFSRSEPEAVEVFDPAETLRTLYPLIMKLAAPRVNVALEAGSNLQLRGSRGGMDQVILNLVSNAVDAMPNGGNLEIHCWSVENDALPVKISVEDTGVGMDAIQLAHCFDPFFTTKDPGLGTGLGLATSTGIVNEFGGRITATSIPEVGTRFLIELPGYGGVSSERQFVADTGRQKSALVVGSQRREVREIGQLLASLDYEVMEAGGVSHALERAAAVGGVDVVVADFALPGMSGLALISTIRELWPACAAVLLTHRGNTNLHPGANGAVLLARPVTASELAEAIRAAVVPAPA